MRKNLGSALAVLLEMASNGGAMAQTQTLEQKIWALLDDPKPAYVSLGEGEFRALGAAFDLPDGGTAITCLAEQAPGGAFDPRNAAKLATARLQSRLGCRTLSPLQPRLGHYRLAPRK